jgi:hypothetical protein
MAVQRARHELLSGSRFAGDEDRRARLRQPADAAEDFLHRRRLAEDLPGLDGSFGCLRLAPSLLEGATDELDHLVDVERLGQVLVRAALERGHRAVEVGIRGHDDHRYRRVAVPHRL